MTSPAETTAPSTPELVLEAGRADAHYWQDLWRYRELLGFLAWRDIQVRYKQTVLGAAWALLQPAITLVVFTYVFGRLAHMPSGNVPYPLLVMAGLLPWQLFANALSNASGSLVSNTHLISKVYFPRLVVPLSALAVALIDFLIVALLYLGQSAHCGKHLLPDQISESLQDALYDCVGAESEAAGLFRSEDRRWDALQVWPDVTPGDDGAIRPLGLDRCFEALLDFG